MTLKSTPISFCSKDLQTVNKLNHAHILTTTHILAYTKLTYLIQHSGRSFVRARVLEPGYESVEWAEVWLDVIEPIIAWPNSLNVCPFSELALGVKVLQGRETPKEASLLKMPHEHFRWTSQSTHATIQKSHGRVQVVSDQAIEGPQIMLVSDRRNQNNSDHTTLYIKTPHKIRLSQAPLYLLQPSIPLEVKLKSCSLPHSLTHTYTHTYSL